MNTVLYFKASARLPSQQRHHGIYRIAKPLGWRIQTVDAVDGAFADVRRILEFWNPDGVLVDCGGLTTPPSVREFGTCPVVFIGRRPRTGEKIFTTCEDLRATGFKAAHELLSMDFRDYAFVGSPARRFWSDERERAFRDAVVLNGKRFHAFTRRVRPDDPLTRAAQLREWLKTLPKPCGLFAANDPVAKEVANACAAEKIDVPGDLAILGVDNDETICERSSPRLSSIAMDFEQSGAIAMRILAARLHTPGMKPVNRTFPPLMVVRRESTRAKAGVNGEVSDAVSFIRQHACERLRAADVVKRMSGSRRLAEIRFRAALGHSILDEIQSVRLERANELLKNRSLSVQAIANFCGYASESSFHRIYRETFGHSPRQSRGA